MNEYDPVIKYISRYIELTNDEINHLIPFFKIKKVKKRQFIVQPGFVCKHKSYVVKGAFRTYLGGDSGYDTHFAEIGKKFDGFDLALLDNGQYNLAWQAIHMLPEEALKAAKDLQTKRLFPVHSSKFKLAYHPWDEPLKTISKLNEKEYHFPLVTPKIGEIVYLNDSTQTFTKWWENINVKSGN